MYKNYLLKCNELITGIWHCREYYFDTETGAMVTGEVERDGRYYYYDDET